MWTILPCPLPSPQAMEQQLSEFYYALALAYTSGRILILPKMVSCHWTTSVDAEHNRTQHLKPLCGVTRCGWWLRPCALQACHCIHNWFESPQCRLPGETITHFPMTCPAVSTCEPDGVLLCMAGCMLCVVPYSEAANHRW
jgi:hypothetical protein